MELLACFRRPLGASHVTGAEGLDGGIRVDREGHTVNRAGVGGGGKPRGGGADAGLPLLGCFRAHALLCMCGTLTAP